MSAATQVFEVDLDEERALEILPTLSADDIDGLEAVLAEELRADFGRFVRWAWPIVDPEPLEWSRALDAMCVHMQAVSEGKIHKLLINIPPGFGKSLIVSVLWPAWQWVRDPTWRILASSYEKGLSIRDSQRCRQIIRDPEYQRLLANSWSLMGDQDAKSFYRTSKGGHRYSTSVGAGTTGHRGSCYLIDDPLSVTDAYSPAKRARANDHVWRVMPSRLNDQRTGVRVMIMQRVHQDDPSAEAIKQGWVHLCLPLEYDPERHCKTPVWEDWRTKPGQSLDPVRFPPEVIADLRRKPGYQAEYQQAPRSDGGDLVREHWIRHYDAIPRAALEHGRWFQSWDLRAGGQSATSSFAVGQVWISYKADLYLVDQVRGRWTIGETMEQIKALSKRWPKADERIVEDKADGKAVKALLGSELSLIMDNPTGKGSKEDRFRKATHKFEAGNVWIPYELPSRGEQNTVSDLVYEWTTSQAPNDDQRDATAQAFERVAFRDVAPMPPVPRSSSSRLDRLRSLSGRHR